MEENNVQPVRCPVTVCGDIHGQFVRLPILSYRVLSLTLHRLHHSRGNNLQSNLIRYLDSIHIVL